MKTISSFALGALLLGAVLLVGCDSGSSGAVQDQVTQLTTQLQTLQAELSQANNAISTLQSEISGLSGGSAGGNSGGAMRIGFVNAEEVFVRFSGTEAAIAEYSQVKTEKENQLRDLNDQYNSGALGSPEFQSRQQQLINELTELDQQLTNDITAKIVEAVEFLGDDLGFELITARKNVVLYYSDNGTVEDLTEQVLEYMNNNFGGGE